MLPAFELLEPQTLGEALEMAGLHPDLMPLAGGTNMIIDLRSRRHTPERIMDISGIEKLSGIKEVDGKIIVGACTTITEIYKHPLIAEHGPCLRAATAVFANPLINNRATIGGNIVDASPAADTAPPLLALGASVELASVKGTRIVPLDEFFLGVRRTALQPGELLMSISWPLLPANSACAFTKLGLRKADAISVVNAAVLVAFTADGISTQVRIALGAVAPTPFRAKEAEALLVGERITDQLISEAAGEAAHACSPISDLRASAAYRREMVRVHVSRLLYRVMEENKRGEQV